MNKEFRKGELIFYREQGEVDLVEVLENSSDDSGVRLRLKVLQNCNYRGAVGTEFGFFKDASSEGCWSVASVGRDYPSYSPCRILRKHLGRMEISYSDILESSEQKNSPKTLGFRETDVREIERVRC